ncbi:MAG: hypothetical protein R2684_03390 [Pyrinomonadaceae bacterium]
MEVLGLAAMGLGSLLVFVGWIWLMVIAFNDQGILWPILIFFFSMFAGLVFCIIYKKGWLQLALMVVGWIISVIGIVPMVMSNMEDFQRSMP